MQHKKLSDAEKKKLIQDILGQNHSAAGKNFPIFSALIDTLGNTNDVLSFAELIPSLNTLLSGATISRIVSTASFAGALLFPVAQLINVINAYQIGHRMYSYRCIVYTTTAWAFDKPIPSSSARILSNISAGPVRKRQAATMEFNKLWRETSISVQEKLNTIAIQKKIPKDHLKAIFRILGGNQPDKLCLALLTQFEEQFDFNTRNIWKSNYSVSYPN